MMDRRKVIQTTVNERGDASFVLSLRLISRRTATALIAATVRGGCSEGIGLDYICLHDSMCRCILVE